MTRPIVICGGGPEPGRAGIERDTVRLPAPCAGVAQLQFDPGFDKARSLMARVHLRQKPTRGLIKFFVLSPIASFHDRNSSDGVLHERGKVIRGLGNLSQGGGRENRR